MPRHQRCPVLATFGEWPPPHNLATPLGRVRIRLIDELGAGCHACGQGPGEFVDHNPLTAYVRGLVCRHCNTHLDTCPHVSGCPWGDYLNAPPAAHLRLVYPNWRRALAQESTRRKIEYLGFDPFADLRKNGPTVTSDAG